MSVTEVSAQSLQECLLDGQELALLDVRERAEFYQAHLLLASCLPIGRMELLLDDVLPRRSVRIVLCDSGDPLEPLARKAAERLQELGYPNVAVLQQGIRGWQAAGLTLYSGLHVPSKAFAEFVRTDCATPCISAAELQAKRDAGEPVLLLDTRPTQECRVLSIPGTVACPGAELITRIHERIPSPDALLVITCSDRSRATLGAQSLCYAELPNPIACLEDGVLGWRLAGFEATQEPPAELPLPDLSALAQGIDFARRIGERFGVTRIDGATLHEWRRQSKKQTLYLLDVRTSEEFRNGHLAGMRNVPSAELLYASDDHLMVRNARIVLFDDSNARATVTAAWLMQMGWRQVYVLTSSSLEETLIVGPHKSRTLGFQLMPTITPEQLHAEQAMNPGIAVIDVSPSSEYRAGHIPGAFWCLRSRLIGAIAHLTHAQDLVLTSSDSLLAHLAACDLQRAGYSGLLRVVAGGNRAWQADEREMAMGMEQSLCDVADEPPNPAADPTADSDSIRAYLDGLRDLPQQIKRSGDGPLCGFP